MAYGSYNFNGLRNLVVGSDTKIPLETGKYVTAINFDNAATTPPFKRVVKELNDFAIWYSSIHRGTGYKSKISSDIYEGTREVIKEFVGSDRDKDVVIFTKNTTESINILSCALNEQKDGKDVIISTWMEHAANDLPWRDKFNVVYAEVDRFGRLSLDSLESKLIEYRGRVKLVAVTGASNVTGYINPIYEIAALAHKYDTKIFVDGAQMVPHAKMNMKPHSSNEHIDFLAFSSHKMYAPYGIGVLIGAKQDFDLGSPFLKGGSAIKLVTHERIQWDCPPSKDEAGTPNLMGVVAIRAAIKELNKIGMDKVYCHEEDLLRYGLSLISVIPDIVLYNDVDILPQEKRIGVIPFNMLGVRHSLLAAMLSYESGISVRNGFFCSHPYCQRLLGFSSEDMETYFEYPEEPKPGIVRVSFGLYNNRQEINKLFITLKNISENKTAYVKKYTSRSSKYLIYEGV